MSRALKPAEFKRACNEAHARSRASERYGVQWSWTEIRQLGGMIAQGESEHVRMLRPDGEHAHRVWVAVRLDGQWFPVVYDNATRSVITCLPERALDPYRERLDPPVVSLPIRPRREQDDTPTLEELVPGLKPITTGTIEETRERRRALAAYQNALQLETIERREWLGPTVEFPTPSHFAEWRRKMTAKMLRISKEIRRLNAIIRPAAREANDRLQAEIIGEARTPLDLLAAARAFLLKPMEADDEDSRRIRKTLAQAIQEHVHRNWPVGQAQEPIE